MVKTRESLAVKYRPLYLEELIGQQEVVNILKGQINSKDGITRSILLTGPTGTGKTTTARIIAHYVNCEKFDVELCRPCGKCDYCSNVAKIRSSNSTNSYPDVEEINFSDEGIETVRQIIGVCDFTSQSENRVFILDELQCMPSKAQNAFLKLLEEPPENTVFVLATTNPEKLLPTITNRCLHLKLEQVNYEELAAFLKDVANTESVSIPESCCYLIAKYARGHVRQAISSLDGVINALYNSPNLDLSSQEQVEVIVGKYIEIPDDSTYAKYLIEGIYYGKYLAALDSIGILLRNTSRPSKLLAQDLLNYHMQTLYRTIDPKKKSANLTDPFYDSWYKSISDAAKDVNTSSGEGKLLVNHKSASAIVCLFVELIGQLGSYMHESEQLFISYTLKMLDEIDKHRSLSYSNKSPLHKLYAPELIK